MIVTSAISAALLTFPDRYQKRWLAFSPSLTFGLFIVVMGLAWLSDTTSAPMTANGWQCAMEITVIALIPTVWLFYSMKNHASTHPYLTGSTALLFAFATGAISLRMGEETNSIIHIMQWHYPLLMIAVLFGGYLGKRWLRW